MIKYLIFSVPNISVLHHIWSTKQTEQSKRGRTTTLTGENNKAWMEKLLIYILGLQQIWTVSLDYLKLNPTTIFPSTIAIIETDEFVRNIMPHLVIDKETNEMNNSPTNKNANESPNNKATSESPKKTNTPRKKCQKLMIHQQVLTKLAPNLLRETKGNLLVNVNQPTVSLLSESLLSN